MDGGQEQEREVWHGQCCVARVVDVDDLVGNAAAVENFDDWDKRGVSTTIQPERSPDSKSHTSSSSPGVGRKL